MRKKLLAKYYDTEKEAKEAANRMNNRARKRIYIVLEEKNGGFLVIHINNLILNPQNVSRSIRKN